MSIIRKYKAHIEEIYNPLPGIFSLSFSSDKKFKYSSGQFLHLALDEYDGIGQWPESRCFSMQSSFTERLLKITFAVKGNFTQRMADELPVRKDVWLKLPYGGLFTQSHDKTDTVFISGGTGITPFLSLFKDNSFAEYKNHVLYAGFKNSEYNIFSNDLVTAKKINPQFEIKIIYQDQYGILDIEKIYYKHIDSTYFISGPPVMIKNFKNYLLQNSLDESKIISDEWE